MSGKLCEHHLWATPPLPKASVVHLETILKWCPLWGGGRGVGQNVTIVDRLCEWDSDKGGGGPKIRKFCGRHLSIAPEDKLTIDIMGVQVLTKMEGGTLKNHTCNARGPKTLFLKLKKNIHFSPRRHFATLWQYLGTTLGHLVTTWHCQIAWGTT